MTIHDDVLEEMAWSEPDACQNCVFFCPWNGIGWGCSHQEVDGLLGGICRCGGKYFKQRRPWKIEGTIVAP
jgi:hypothetical protein